MSNKTRKIPTVDESSEAAIIEDAPKPKGGKRYWVRPIHIHGLGQQKGLVTNEAAKAFTDFAKETGSGAKITDWTTDKDLEAERLKEARRKMRANLGLKEE